MKKLVSLTLAALTMLSLSACGKAAREEVSPSTTLESIATETEPNTTEAEPLLETEPFLETEPHDFVEINISPDKYTWYMKDYYGKNLASFGYTALGGFRADHYGDGYMHFAFLTPNGEYVDIQDQDDMSKWRVVGQSIAPNTEIKYTYGVEEDGTESESWVEYQTVDELVLALAPVGKSVEAPVLTPILPSPDPHIEYVRDYVGRNLSQCGYVSMGGNLTQQYGTAYVRLIVNTDDGSLVDLQDKDALKKYVVIGQSIAPNSEIKLGFEKDSNGKESLDLVHAQNIEEIDLYVVPLDRYDGQSKQTGGNIPAVSGNEDAVRPADADAATSPAAPETTIPATIPESTEPLVDGMRPEFKEAMDTYEAFYNEYCDFLSKYVQNPTDFSLLSQYAGMLSKAGEMDAAFKKWDEDDLNSAELQYYLEVNSRVLQKLAGVMSK